MNALVLKTFPWQNLLLARIAAMSIAEADSRTVTLVELQMHTLSMLQVRSKQNCCQHISNLNVIIPACPDGWTRFADNCFKPLQSVQGDIYANADDCADIGGLLWYPESQSEITFVSNAFPAGSVGQYHLGVKSFQSTGGITFIDDSVNPGITFYTSNNFLMLKE